MIYKEIDVSFFDDDNVSGPLQVQDELRKFSYNGYIRGFEKLMVLMTLST